VKISHRTFAALFLFACLAAALVGLQADADEKHPIPWMDDYASTLEKAQASNRLVMIEFWTTWCQYCGKLEKETLGDPRVVELSKEFVCAKLDADVQKVAASRYRPDGYPTVLFATPTGDEIVRVSGFKAADPFYTVMKIVHARGLEMADYFARLDDNPKDLEASEALGATYLDLGITEKAMDHLTRALKLARSSSASGDDEAATRIQVLIGRAEREQENFKKASKILEKLIAEHPASAELPTAYLELEGVYDDWGKKNKVTQVRDKGRSFYDTHCSSCHGEDRKGSEEVPPLVGIEDRWTMAELAQYILDPAAYRAKHPRLQELDERYAAVQMPAVDLPEERKEALVVWVMTSSIESSRMTKAR
jgi:thiol:disulfide interchange protein DsbD